MLYGLGNWTTKAELYPGRRCTDGNVVQRAAVKSGAENPMAKFAQQMLLAYGYSLPNFGADGEFWEESVTATIQYQQDHGLVADGVIGVVTWKDMLQVI